MTMQHTKIKHGTFGWWLLMCIPLINVIAYWKVARLIAEHEEI
jgi:hypothetical protein